MSALTFHRYRNRSLCVLLGSPVTLIADLNVFREAKHLVFRGCNADAIKSCGC